MTATLTHRGPDDSGFWCEGSVSLGFRRLAIIDTSPSGHQPMVSPDGEHVLVFNGEIFNYVELRDELRSLGHNFRSTSDTEVLLVAWRQWGERAVDRLIGMFAFAIWDRKRGGVFGARDRFGVKPLFVYHGPDVVILASEIKAIHASGVYKHRENWKAIARYLVDGQLDVDTSTCFEGIEQIAPAHTFHLGPSGDVRQHRYFDLPTAILEHVDDAPATIADMLEESIRIRMRSDVPIGICLSGGLDSTAIACAVARRRRAAGDWSPILAFSYNTPEYDESLYLNETIRETGATLIPWQADVRETWASLSRVLHFNDEPVHSMNALVGFQLMGLARRHGAVVVLNGQGADETLAGYSSYYVSHWVTLVATGHARQAHREIGAFAAAFGENAQRVALGVLRTVMFRAMRWLPGYGAAARLGRAAERRGTEWFTPELTSALPDRGLVASSRLETVQRQAVSSSPLRLYLRIEDRNSMAHGVEVRLPFLDHRLVSYALSLPTTWRMRGQWNKYALREALRGRIPELVRTRLDKMGFPTPSGKWFGRELHEPLRALLDSRSARSRGLFRTDKMLHNLDCGRDGDVANHLTLFRAANVETWLSMLADRRAEHDAADRPIDVRSGIPVYREGLRDRERLVALSNDLPPATPADRTEPSMIPARLTPARGRQLPSREITPQG